MVIVKIVDTTADVTTHAIIENVHTLTRNYVTNYRAEHLNHIATQIEITVVAKINDAGNVIASEQPTKTLAKCLEEYDSYMEKRYSQTEMI